MDIIINIAVSLLTALSVGCLSYVVFSLAQDMQIEKTDSTRKLPILFRLLLPLAPNIMPIVNNPVFEKSKRQTREHIFMAGCDQIIDEERFTAVNILTVILGLLLFILAFLYGQLLIGLMLLVLMAIYPKSWIRGAIKRRHLEIQKALPNVLDLLTLSVEAGRDFLTSLRDILARRKRDALCEELERAFREIQLGKQRRVALKELGQRVQQPDLTIVLNSIIQADELGVSIGQILKIQGDQLRLKRFNRAEKLANEAPVKILFPLAIFIMPAVIIILLGPVILKGFNILLK